MKPFLDGPIPTMPITASNTLFAWAMVKVVAGALTLCGAGDNPDGFVSPHYDGNTSYAPFVQRKAPRVPFGKADAAITSGAPVYCGASGTISMTATGPCIGVALQAATAAGDEIQYLPRGIPNGDSFRIVAAGTALTNSTTETALATHAIPANRLRAGTRIRFFAQVIATSTNSTDTLTLKISLGGLSNVVFATAAIDVANNDIGVISGEIVIRTSGASGTMVGAGIGSLGVPTTGTARGSSMASTAIDTTAANNLVISGTWSVASASNSCRCDIFNADIID